MHNSSLYSGWGNRTLSSAEASYSRALTARLGKTRGGWEEGKIKAREECWKGKEKKELFPLPIVPRAPVFYLQRSRSRIFLSQVFINRSLCEGERVTGA